MARRRTLRRRRLTDLLSILRADHAHIGKLLARFERLRPISPIPLQQLIEEVCEELETHAMVEEQIFYPAIRGGLPDAARVDECEVAHENLRVLIAGLRRRPPEDPKFTATFMVIAAHIRVHMKAEERHLFARARRARLDLQELGLRAQTLRKSLLGQQDAARSPAITGPDAEAAERHLRGEESYRDVARH